MAVGLHCEVELEVASRHLSKKASVEVFCSGEGADTLPRGTKNLIAKTFFSRVDKARYRYPFRFAIDNGVPLSRGLGSSAAARLCGLLLADAFLRKTSPADLSATVLEAVRAEGHPDNVVPAFFGGLRSARFESGALYQSSWKVPKGLAIVLCVPDFEVSTERARAVMPKKVPLSSAVAASSRTTMLLAALKDGRFEDLAVAMRDDLHQPYRKRLVKGMDAVIKSALKAGAFGASLSGSGSTMLALAPEGRAASGVGQAMSRAFRRSGARSRVLTPGIDTRGAVLKAR